MVNPPTFHSSPVPMPHYLLLKFLNSSPDACHRGIFLFFCFYAPLKGLNKIGLCHNFSNIVNDPGLPLGISLSVSLNVSSSASLSVFLNVSLSISLSTSIYRL